MTNFENGIASFGFPVIGSSGYISVRAAANKQIYFVDGTSGNDGNTGKSVDAATKTIQKAVDKCSNDLGGYVFIGEGVYSEQVTVTKRGIHLIGMGAGRTILRYASPTTISSYDGVSPMIIVAPEYSAGKPMGVEIANMTVGGNGGYSGIYIGDGSNGAQASYTYVHNCILDGANLEGQYGIVIRGGSYIQIHNNMITSWLLANVVIDSGLTRTAYYNEVIGNRIVGGGVGIALNDTANSNFIIGNYLLDASTNALGSTIAVTAVLGGACVGTDNCIAGNYDLSGGTEATLGASDWMAGNYKASAGNGSVYVSEA